MVLEAGGLAIKGRMTGLFCLGYGMARFLVELVREPDPQIGLLLGGISMGQLLTLPMIAVGLVLLLGRRQLEAPMKALSDHDLSGRLIAEIDRSGPIRLSSFMTTALSDSQLGYYQTRDPFGNQGDFTTAPEISGLLGRCAASF